MHVERTNRVFSRPTRLIVEQVRILRRDQVIYVAVLYRLPARRRVDHSDSLCHRAFCHANHRQNSFRDRLVLAKPEVRLFYHWRIPWEIIKWLTRPGQSRARSFRSPGPVELLLSGSPDFSRNGSDVPDPGRTAARRAGDLRSSLHRRDFR